MNTSVPTTQTAFTSMPFSATAPRASATSSPEPGHDPLYRPDGAIILQFERAVLDPLIGYVDPARQAPRVLKPFGIVMLPDRSDTTAARSVQGGTTA